MSKIYRNDIDGLRAIAVVSVILFHLGYLPNGYLGVDIFFVISGYLITGIVYAQVEDGRFSMLNFYERRLRRIIPLVLFVTGIALVLGLLFMLPDDLENLCQSVFASNFSANNILMKLTSADYWSVRNDYKPLMHTWSLGIEEQFYLLFPLLFFLLQGRRKKYILPVLLLLTLLSLGAFFTSADESARFYFIQYRFFELAIGGACAIYFSKVDLQQKFSGSQHLLLIFLFLLVLLLIINAPEYNTFNILAATILTAGVLVLGNLHFQNNPVYKRMLSNRAFVAVGKISFSLYMWHQLVFAFARYAFLDEITPFYAVLLSLLILVLSVITYYVIENPFRNRQKVKLRPLLISLGTAFLIISGSSLFVYMIGGIIKDVPELGIYAHNRPAELNFFNRGDNIHIKYNENVKSLNRPFAFTGANLTDESTNKVKVLILGNSFGRDMANILMESAFSEKLELSYGTISDIFDEEIKKRIQEASVIFFGSSYPDEFIVEQYDIDLNKVWIVGTKDFGNSNGIHYNRSIENYAMYRTLMKSGVYEENQKQKKIWKERYIDMISYVADHQGRVLVFTPDGKFISQDTVHLTEAGAKFFAVLLKDQLEEILKFSTVSTSA